MKRNVSVTFKEPDKDSALIHYYGNSKLKNSPRGSGWSIDGTFSTDTSPHPTPPSSPIPKYLRADYDMDDTTEEFSKLLSNGESHQKPSAFPSFELFQSMTSMPPITLPGSSTLLSFQSTPHASAEELTIDSSKPQKSKSTRRKKAHRPGFLQG